MLTDIRYALRLLVRAPLLASSIIVTVALAVAANTAIFSVVNAVLLRPLPFKAPNELVQVAEKNDRLKLSNFGASVLNFQSWRERSKSFEDLAAVASGNYTLSGTGEPEQLIGSRISPALTRVLGISPLAGRTFRDDEEAPGAAPVALIGEGLWKRRFGSDLSLVGRTLNLNGQPTTVVGVLPSALNLLTGADIYTPLKIDATKEIRLNHVIFVVGRLRKGTSLTAAQAEMDTVAASMGRDYPEVKDWGVHLVSLFDTFVSTQLKIGVLMLLASVTFVLMIACANIANLLLARATTRQQEMAVRTALGANRARLVRQLLVESLVYSTAGGVTGLVGAYWAVGFINRALPPTLLPVPEVKIDTTVMCFALGLTLLTALLFGAAPAWRTSHVDISGSLKAGGRGSVGAIPRRIRNLLVVGELALATILLAGAALFLQSLANLQRVHLGFDSRSLITFQLAPPTSQYPLANTAPQLYRSALDSLQSIPGVQGAAISSGLPFGAGNYTTHPMLTTGPSVLAPGTLVPIDWRIVSPGYFRTMGIPLLSGRDFTDADGPTSTPVMIVSQATAKRFWGDEYPIGRTLTRSADLKTSFTVVGVVGDVRSTALNQESPALYYPMAWRVWPLMDVAVRGSGSVESLLPSIRGKVHEIDPDLALANARTMDQWLQNSTAQPRLNSIFLAAFAVIALLIALTGIYGVLAYSVNQRTREIGLRMALGATPQNVLRLVVKEGMSVAVAGIALGVIGGLALGRAVSSLVFGVTVRDPIIFTSIAIGLAVASFAACAIPARRAARVDPIIALRDE